MGAQWHAVRELNKETLGREGGRERERERDMTARLHVVGSWVVGCAHARIKSSCFASTVLAAVQDRCTKSFFIASRMNRRLFGFVGRELTLFGPASWTCR